MRFGRLIAIVLMLSFAMTSGSGAFPLFKGGVLIFDVGEDVPGKLPAGDPGAGCVADLNGDGKDDIVVENGMNVGPQPPSTVSVLLSASAPALPTIFRPKANLVIGPDFRPIVLDDFNNDGKPDLLSGVDSTLMFFAGDGLGGFSTYHVDTNIHCTYMRILTGDLNGDGNLDVLFTPIVGPFYPIVFFGTGTGSFTAGPTTYTEYKMVRVLHDVTGDGKPDLLGWDTYPPESLRVGVGRGDGTFDPPVYSATTEVCAGSHIQVGDFDEDSIPDLVIVNPWGCPPLIDVRHGSGDGYFSEITTITLPRGDNASFGVRDMDLDGHLDLVVTFNHRDSNHPPGQGVNNLLVLFGDGTGHFPTQRWMDGGGNPCAVLLGDFDGNGLPDIATTSLFDPPGSYPTAHAVNVLLNQGDRDFGTGPDRAAAYPPESEQVADVNRDGIPDLLVADNDAKIEVHLGVGGGGYGATLLQPLTPAYSATRFAIGDINRDGRLDVASSGAGLLFGNGDGTFSAGAEPVAGSTREESLTDLDRDGRLDLILLGTSTLDVQLGNGVGGFGTAVSYALPTPGRDFHVDDWNRDGKPDVAVATQAGIVLFTGSASGTLTQAATIEPSRAFADVTSGDFNRDGWPDLAGRDEYGAGAPADAGGASIYLANGAGGFGSRTTLPAFDRLGSEVASWDVNRDGSPDIVATGQGDWTDISYSSHATYASATVWLGNGTGAFRRDSDYFVGLRVNAARISFGDADGDGQPDILGSNDDWITDTTSVHYVSCLRGAMPPFTGQFAGHVEYPASSGPVALAVADWNRDGRTDVAAVGGIGVDILLGNGSGGLAQTSTIEVGNGVVAADAADLDRDGDMDLVAIANDGSCSLVINDGQGQFSTIPIHVGSDVSDMALGDLNHDGIPDLVVCDIAAGSIVVKLGTGAPGFGDPVEYFPANGGYHVALGDVNRDGWLDVVVDDPWLGNVAIFLNDGRGRLFESAYVAIGVGARDLLLADVNRDGRLDIVATRGSGQGVLTILLANGMGGFGAPKDFALYNDLRGISLGDVDADGIQDLLVATEAGLLVLRGDGSGNFQYYDSHNTGIPAWSVAQADLDRDGRPDLITANAAGNVSVLLGSDAAPTGVPVAAAPSVRVCLSQNRPNPFNPHTEIRFSLPQAGPVRLRVFDAAGRAVITLANGPLGPGEHRVSWDGRTGTGAPAASGVYFYRLETPGFVDAKRMVLLR